MDGGATLLLVGGLVIPVQDSTFHTVLAFGGLGAFALGGPIIHGQHGRGLIGLLDLVLRVGSLAASFVLGLASIDSPPKTQALVIYGPPVVAILTDALALTQPFGLPESPKPRPPQHLPAADAVDAVHRVGARGAGGRARRAVLNLGRIGPWSSPCSPHP